MDGDEQDDRNSRTYHESIDPTPLLSADRSRLLTPRELVFVLIRGQFSPEYVHAMARRYLRDDIR